MLAIQSVTGSLRVLPDQGAMSPGPPHTRSPEIVGKAVALLRELIPGATRLAALVVPSNSGTPLAIRQAQSAATSLGLELIVVGVDGGPRCRLCNDHAGGLGLPSRLRRADAPYEPFAARGLRG